MSNDQGPVAFRGGQIVLADWRGDALPKEANKRRPAIVVEDSGLFVPDYPNVLLVPMTTEHRFVIPDLCVQIDPTPENDCPMTSRALSNLVTATSKRRVQPTGSRIKSDQLHRIRRQIGFALGLEF